MRPQHCQQESHNAPWQPHAGEPPVAISASAAPVLSAQLRVLEHLLLGNLTRMWSEIGACASQQNHSCPSHQRDQDGVRLRRVDIAAAGRRFAEVLLQHYQPGDVVWVQDYHLMMLPELLKQRQPKMKVRCWLQLLVTGTCCPAASHKGGQLGSDTDAASWLFR